MAPSCTILAARSATILAFLRALHCRTLHTARAAADVDATATKAERARGVDMSCAGTNNFGLQMIQRDTTDATPQGRDPRLRCSEEPMGNAPPEAGEISGGRWWQRRENATCMGARGTCFRAGGQFLISGKEKRRKREKEWAPARNLKLALHACRSTCSWYQRNQLVRNIS